MSNTVKTPEELRLCMELEEAIKTFKLDDSERHWIESRIESESSKDTSSKAALLRFEEYLHNNPLARYIADLQ